MATSSHAGRHRELNSRGSSIVCSALQQSRGVHPELLTQAILKGNLEPSFQITVQGAAQSRGASSGYAAQAPVQRLQIVQTPNPRRYEYAGDLANGSPQAAAAYARQVGIQARI